VFDFLCKANRSFFMQPFQSAAHMLAAQEAMFGPAGAYAVETVLRWAPRLFAVPLDPLNIRVILAPIEMGAYNQHTGYHVGSDHHSYIVGNRHHCRFCSHGEIHIDDVQAFDDFIIHELTHRRQAMLLRENAGTRGWIQHPGRGSHRDKGWYQAISEAAPNYLGIEIPEHVWPKRGSETTLTEPEMTHWPESLRALVKARDPRLVAEARPSKAVAALALTAAQVRAVAKVLPKAARAIRKAHGQRLSKARQKRAKA
jgi:hypothetical protein